MKKLFTGMDRQRQSNPRWPCKKAASCSSLKGQVQESSAENPRELPEGLGGGRVTIRSRGPEGSTSACRMKGGHTNNQTLPLIPSGNSQGDSKMPGQLEDRNRTSSQKMVKEKEAERE